MLHLRLGDLCACERKALLHVPHGCVFHQRAIVLVVVTERGDKVERAQHAKRVVGNTEIGLGLFDDAADGLEALERLFEGFTHAFLDRQTAERWAPRDACAFEIPRQ